MFTTVPVLCCQRKTVFRTNGCSFTVYLSLFLSHPRFFHPRLQMYQSSPGGQSSCSSEPSPLGTNNDSGVETAAHSGGSLGDLSTLDDLPFVESLGFEDSSGGVVAVGLYHRKQLSTSQRLEHLKKEKLNTMRDSCRWASYPTPPVLGTKLPPIPTSGKLGFQGLYVWRN